MVTSTKNGTAKAAEVIDEAEAKAAKAARIAAKKKAEAAAAEKAPKKAKAEAKPETSDVDVDESAKALAKLIRATVYKQFKVALPTREQQ